MRRMPIRYKMTLLYSALTALLLLIFLPTLYFAMRSALMNSQRDLLKMANDQVASQIEQADGTEARAASDAEDSADLPTGAAYLVTDSTQTIASHNMSAELAALPFLPGRTREVRAGGSLYLLMDGFDTEDNGNLRIRTCLTMDALERALETVRMVGLVGAPLILAAAGLLGLLVAKRSLKPVERIITSAKVVASGDLSTRISPAPSRDEVGALTEMLNEMLDKLEASFLREKRFASDASHELRTPVSVIMAYAETLAVEESLDEDARQSVQTILGEAQRMRRMISQLLTVTRGDEGRYPVSMEKMDMAEVARAVCDQMQNMSDERGITLELDAQSAPLTGDQSLLTQLTLNLIENAIKYGKPGGHVRVESRLEEGACRLQVSDDGPGILPEHLPHIFERFYRADSARDRTGSGLGLSIVRWIVDLHRGTIRVASSPDGTRFDVSLPA